MPMRFKNKLVHNAAAYFLPDWRVQQPKAMKLHIPVVLVVFPAYRRQRKVVKVVMALVPIQLDKPRLLPMPLPLVWALKQSHLLQRFQLEMKKLVGLESP